MPPTSSKSSSATPAALAYITLGGILSVWSGVWFAYLYNTGSQTRGLYYVCAGLFLSGLGSLFVGLMVGRISRKAQEGELVAQATAAKAAAVQQNPQVAQHL